MQAIPIEFQIKPFIVLILIVSLTSLIIIYSKLNENIGNKREIRAFKGMLVAFMVYALVDIRLIIGDGFYTTFPRTFVLFVVSVGFGTMSVACFFWFMHVRATLHTNDRDKNSKRARLINVLIYVPLLICLIFLFTPLYTNIYQLTEYGPMFQPLILMILLLDYVYLITATGISIHNMRKAKTKLEKKKYRSQTVFIVFFTISGYLIGFLLSFPAIELCVIPVVLHIFAQLQDSQIYTDALTKVYNRRRVAEFITDGIATCSPEDPMCIMMIDLDYFKNINDILGHDAGDKALINFSNALLEIVRTKDALFGRWGGDEFIVAGKEKDLASGFREKLIEVLEKHNDLGFALSFSLGTYYCTSPHMTCEQAVTEADAVLYKDKEAHHQKAEQFLNELEKVRGK